MPTLSPPTAPTAFRRPALRPRIASALVAGIGLLAGMLTLPASGAAATLSARSAADFRDSIGVQTHFPFTGYPYDTASTDELAGMLRTVGIRHLRDDVCFNTESACQRVRSRLAAMQGALGPGAPSVDLMALYSREIAAVPGRADRDADIERALTAATTSPLAPMIAGLEPVNEPDLKNSVGWEQATLADDDTFRRLLAEPRFGALRGRLHLSPAIGHASNTPSLFASGWSAARADAGNFHPYPPAWGGPENALGTACGTTDALGCARSLGRASAPIATESGYSTSGNAFSTNWVSEKAQGIYLPRLLLENFRSGVARTYLYELIDLKPQRGSAVDGFGLWRAQASGSTFVPGSPKPAALALARMNATIGDLGAAATSGALDVTIRASGREVGDDTVRRVLLRRADGSYVLALWQPQSVWTNAVLKQSDRAAPDLETQVTIGGGTWNARASRPSLGDGATGTWTATATIGLPVGADVTLLELAPNGVAVSTAPAPAPPAAAPANATVQAIAAAAGAVAPAPAAAATRTAPAPTPTPTSKTDAQAAAFRLIAQWFTAALDRALKIHAAPIKRASSRSERARRKAKAARRKARAAGRSKRARAGNAARTRRTGA